MKPTHEGKRYTLYHGDCLQVLPELAAGCIDLTVTSPPYDNLRTYGDEFEPSAFNWRSIIKELYRVTADGGVVVWVVADATINGSETGTSFRQALWAMECGFNLHDTMIYASDKPPLSHNRYEQAHEYMFVFSKGTPKTVNLIKGKSKRAGEAKFIGSFREKNGETRPRNTPGFVSATNIISNIWHYDSGFMLSSNIPFVYSHPATFPESLARDHILSWSNEGDVVLDPMMGSGTVGAMALPLKRKFIGIDLGYFDISHPRIANAAGDFCPAPKDNPRQAALFW